MCDKCKKYYLVTYSFKMPKTTFNSNLMLTVPLLISLVRLNIIIIGKQYDLKKKSLYTIRLKTNLWCLNIWFVFLLPLVSFPDSVFFKKIELSFADKKGIVAYVQRIQYLSPGKSKSAIN